MTRRLLGYVVKLPDGTRHTEGPLSLLDAVSISHGSVPPTHVVPVFSKPKPAPVVAAEVPAAIYVVVSASHGALTTTMSAFEDAARRDHAASVAAGDSTTSVLRYVPDGEHEAACEAARWEGAEAALHDARRTLLDLTDDFAGEHAAGLRHAVRCVYDMIQATKEAAKGQAK